MTGPQISRMCKSLFFIIFGKHDVLVLSLNGFILQKWYMDYQTRFIENVDFSASDQLSFLLLDIFYNKYFILSRKTINFILCIYLCFFFLLHPLSIFWLNVLLARANNLYFIIYILNDIFVIVGKLNLRIYLLEVSNWSLKNIFLNKLFRRG